MISIFQLIGVIKALAWWKRLSCWSTHCRDSFLPPDNSSPRWAGLDDSLGLTRTGLKILLFSGPWGGGLEGPSEEEALAKVWGLASALAMLQVCLHLNRLMIHLTKCTSRSTILSRLVKDPDSYHLHNFCNSSMCSTELKSKKVTIKCYCVTVCETYFAYY